MICRICGGKKALYRPGAMRTERQARRCDLCLERPEAMEESGRIRVGNQLREEVEYARNECRLMTARPDMTLSGEERQRGLMQLEKALRRLAAWVLDGVFPAGLNPGDFK
jgi:hypothetical protein